MVTVSATDATTTTPNTTATAKSAPTGDVEDDDDEDDIEAEDDQAEQAEAISSTGVAGVTCQLYLRLAGLIDTKAEVARAKQNIAKLALSIDTLLKARARPEYSQKVPVTKQMADAQKVNFYLDFLVCCPSPVALS